MNSLDLLDDLSICKVFQIKSKPSTFKQGLFLETLTSSELDAVAVWQTLFQAARRMASFRSLHEI